MCTLPSKPAAIVVRVVGGLLSGWSSIQKSSAGNLTWPRRRCGETGTNWPSEYDVTGSRVLGAGWPAPATTTTHTRSSSRTPDRLCSGHPAADAGNDDLPAQCRAG